LMNGLPSTERAQSIPATDRHFCAVCENHRQF